MSVVSPNKLLTAVPRRSMDKKRRFWMAGILFFVVCLFLCLLEVFKKPSGLVELKGDISFVLNPPSRKTIFLDCKSGGSKPLKQPTQHVYFHT